MALLSNVDWTILLIVGAFLLFGRENRAILRTLGRYYARALRLKQDLLTEVGRAADLPPPIGGRSSLRASLLGLDEPLVNPPGIPIAVARPPGIASASPIGGWAGSLGPETWSIALPTNGVDLRRGP